jgi:hypothetical protein
MRDSEQGHRRAVVLAGDEGTRPTPLVRCRRREEGPRQCATPAGSTSLLPQSAERVALQFATSRILVATQACHARCLDEALAGLPEIRVLSGPADRGTAGMLAPAHWLGTRDPRATVAVFRTDHLAREETRFIANAGLGNTSVFAASVGTLIEAGTRSVPLLHDRLVRLGVFVGTQHEAWALRQAYVFAPAVDLSPALLQSSGLPLAVAESPAFTWCDLATPERLARSLALLRPSA